MSTADRHWREAGATSAGAAVSVYTPPSTVAGGGARPRSLQGARLRLSRAYLAVGGDAGRARGAAHPTFDPGEMLTFYSMSAPCFIFVTHPTRV